MKSVKKMLGKIASVVVIIIIVLIGLFIVFGERAIKVAIETAGTKALNVAVKVDDVDLSLIKGQMKISGLEVANPAGFKMPNILAANEIYAKLDTGSLLSDTIIVEEIRLDGIKLSFEQKGFDSNVAILLKGTPSVSKKEGKSEDPKSSEDDASGKKLVIDNLVLTNTIVEVKLLPVPGAKKDISIKLPKIQMKDIGKNEEFDLAKLNELIFLAISEELTKAGGGIIPSDALKGLEELDPGALLTGSFEGLFGEEGLGAEAIEQLGDTGKDIIDGIGGLFDQKKDKK